MIDRNLKHKKGLFELTNSFQGLTLGPDSISLFVKLLDKLNKKNNNVTILQAGRWNELREKAIGKAVRLNLSEDFIEKYMDAVHMESINRQNKIMNA